MWVDMEEARVKEGLSFRVQFGLVMSFFKEAEQVCEEKYEFYLEQV